MPLLVGRKAIEAQDATGRRLGAARLPGGYPDPTDMIIGIETDRGTWVQAPLATGYQVYAINPRQVARFKERYGTSGVKSDKGDAHALAYMVRIERDQLRPRVAAAGAQHR